ncbi:trans-aconitate 2-methyltransferase [Ancylobacter aquaticus]|uniref:Trans-aconitate 2-methyltransferase n=1 Tax=Ancylobacter aquaticus TaxID=100 RepID=A0A4R1I7Q9_ANCAQ|nr:trans-aconitate 2-methyltransferase [Ancylobacter aquaticus]TCK28799.1 trans-aconitate 2-methyltransferase [Ancylobacter aquaticus]
MADDWNPALYLAFEDERTRPPRDLLAAVPLERARRVVDLGCGPGNSTELLAARWPDAEVIGVDNSPAMLEQARARLPAVRFELGDLASWAPAEGTDLLFANAVFQWVPDHLDVLARLLEGLAPGGVLAVQMPDNVAEPSHLLMEETAAAGPWADRVAGMARDRLPGVGAYYDRLAPLARHVDIWHTLYNHPLAGGGAIAEWFRSTGLRSYLAPLDETERAAFLADYTARLEQAYPVRVDGRVLLRFPRRFIVAVR